MRSWVCSDWWDAWHKVHARSMHRPAIFKDLQVWFFNIEKLPLPMLELSFTERENIIGNQLLHCQVTDAEDR